MYNIICQYNFTIIKTFVINPLLNISVKQATQKYKKQSWVAYIWENLRNIIKLYNITDKSQKLVVLFVDVHRCFPVFYFLFWLARSLVTDERQTKIKNCKKAPREQHK